MRRPGRNTPRSAPASAEFVTARGVNRAAAGAAAASERARDFRTLPPSPVFSRLRQRPYDGAEPARAAGSPWSRVEIGDRGLENLVSPRAKAREGGLDADVRLDAHPL